jgi:prepilin-type N-terminal cleavage/methylation domain-containing protein
MKKGCLKIKYSRFKSGFSLIELSIVILIVTTLIAGSLSVSKTSINNSKVAVTKKRIETVYKALASFVATNRRLPCPALLTTTKGSASYGNEASTPGTCSGFTVATSTNLIYGMIPIKALGLEPDMAEDGWGTKFSYVVDRRFTLTSTNTSSTDGFEITQALPAPDKTSNSIDIITIEGPSGTDLTTYALFVLISHGANKYGGWNASGTIQNQYSSATTDEQSNRGSASGGGEFDDTFIAFSTDVGFDDIILYANKTKLLRDAGFEYAMCNTSEAETDSYSWATNGRYGCSVCSETKNHFKKCGKYGIWGASVNKTCLKNTSICPNTIYQPDEVIYSDNKGDTFDTCTAGAWRTRELDTARYEKDDSNSFSLSSNQITLQPGKYFIKAGSSSLGIDQTVLRFYNITDNDGTFTLQGISNYSSDSSSSGSLNTLVGVIDISSAKTFELQQRCADTNSFHGFGVYTTFTDYNIYAIVKITKLND